MIWIRAKSSGFDGSNLAEITIDDKPVTVHRSGQDNSRGLHLVIINPFTGIVEMAQVFDTYQDGACFADFIKWYDIPDGYIIVAACKDDCVSKLTDKGKEFFAKMGSK